MDDKELGRLRARIEKADRIKNSIECIESLLENNFSVRPFAPEFGDHGQHVQRSFGDSELEEEVSRLARKAAEYRLQELKEELKKL